MGNYFIISKRNLDHLCPAVYAMTKMADLKKFRQSEGMFMDSTILASFSQIHQNEISKFSPFSLLHVFPDISHLDKGTF